MRIYILFIITITLTACKKDICEHENSELIFFEDFSSQGDWSLNTANSDCTVAIENGVLELNSAIGSDNYDSINYANLNLDPLELGDKICVEVKFIEYYLSNIYEHTDLGEVPTRHFNMVIGDVFVGATTKEAKDYTDLAPNLNGKTLVINLNLRNNRLWAKIKEDDLDVSDYFNVKPYPGDSYIHFETEPYHDWSLGMTSETSLAVDEIKISTLY